MFLPKILFGMTAILLLTAVPSKDASATDDVIAKEAERCLGSPQGQTTAGMQACSAAAYQAYDRQMNEIYANVMRHVDPKSQSLIRSSQRAWIAYRDAKTAADGAPWQAERGSMVGPDLKALRVDAIKTRIQELRYYGP